jgi:hypothetical protein
MLGLTLLSHTFVSLSHYFLLPVRLVEVCSVEIYAVCHSASYELLHRYQATPWVDVL